MWPELPSARKIATWRLRAVTRVTVGNMSNCRFGRCDAFFRCEAGRRQSCPCSARHSGITRHLHFTAGACPPELFARGLCRLGPSDPGAAKLLARMIEARLAFLISGGTGSGKPTLGLRQGSGSACLLWFGQVLHTVRSRLRTSSRDLNKDAVPTAQGARSWSQATVRALLGVVG
jgi:hypothetical protein